MENWNIGNNMGMGMMGRQYNSFVPSQYNPPAPHYEIIKVNGEAGARKLDYLIDHVEKEIEHAEEKMMALENSGYDMNYILQEQEHMKMKYADKIRKLNEKDSLFRRRGSGNYANYNNDDDCEDDDEFTYRNYRNNYRRYYDRY